MDCLTCGTELTPSNATSFRHVHDVGNCAQVLLAQRDRARALLVEVSNVWGGFKTDFERFQRMDVLLDKVHVEVGLAPRQPKSAPR